MAAVVIYSLVGKLTLKSINEWHLYDMNVQEMCRKVRKNNTIRRKYYIVREVFINFVAFFITYIIKSMLKLIRKILAVIFWLGITLLFLDFTGTLMQYLGWMAKVQFLPSVLALNIGVVLLWLLATLLFGRI